MKLNEMREKSVDELQNAIVDWKKDLFNYKLQLSRMPGILAAIYAI